MLKRPHRQKRTPAKKAAVKPGKTKKKKTPIVSDIDEDPPEKVVEVSLPKTKNPCAKKAPSREEDGVKKAPVKAGKKSKKTPIVFDIDEDFFPEKVVDPEKWKVVEVPSPRQRSRVPKGPFARRGSREGHPTSRQESRHQTSHTEKEGCRVLHRRQSIGEAESVIR